MWLLLYCCTCMLPYYIYGWAYDISNQNPRWTQKPIYSPIFIHHSGSWLIDTPVNNITQMWTENLSRYYHLTRVTKSHLSALGTTQISSYITKRWTKFPFTTNSKLIFSTTRSHKQSRGTLVWKGLDDIFPQTRDFRCVRPSSRHVTFDNSSYWWTILPSKVILNGFETKNVTG